MPLFAVGLNHRTAPIDVREKFAFPLEAQPAALAALKARAGVREAVLLSTCNRTEVYFGGGTPQSVTGWLQEISLSKGLDVSTHLYTVADLEMARHAFRVASGLDSMVLGEPQILGQVKLAVRMAGESGTLGTQLDRLFQHTFSVAKEVRTNTAIGEQSISMAAAALRLANRIFGDLSAVNVLLIGVGEMTELAGAHFAAQKPRRIVVANRTLERGQAFAARLSERAPTQAITLKELPDRFHEFDAIVTATSSSLPIIGKGLVERALKARKHRPIFIVDLAVPRDVEPEVAELDDVFLYTLDGLASVVQEGVSKREAAVADAERIIDRCVGEFDNWRSRRASVPVIQMLRGKAEDYRRGELARAQKMLARGDDPQQVLEQFSLGLTNKFLHHPLHALNSATPAEREALARALAQLYPEPESGAASAGGTGSEDRE